MIAILPFVSYTILVSRLHVVHGRWLHLNRTCCCVPNLFRRLSLKSADNSPLTYNQRPMTRKTNKQMTISDQRSTTSDQRPATTHQRPMTKTRTYISIPFSFPPAVLLSHPNHAIVLDEHKCALSNAHQWLLKVFEIVFFQNLTFWLLTIDLSRREIILCPVVT